MAKKKSKAGLNKFLPVSAGGPEVSSVEDQPFTQPDLNGSDDRRIRTCSDARDLYTRLFLENQLRAQTLAQVRNQIEGGRPFDPAVLARNGESWRTNVNFRDAEAAFGRAYTPYWKMLHEVPRLITVDVETQAPDADRWGVAMAEAFDLFVAEWGPDYFLQVQGVIRDYIKYGPGFAMWPDSRTPRFKWSNALQMLFPKRTKSNTDDWELVACRRDMPANELIEKIRDSKEAGYSKDAGWNPEMVQKAIALAAPGPQQTRYLDPNFWQDMIVQNDLVIGGVWPPISVVDVWAKQRAKPGQKPKVRHYILTEKTDVPDYLYEMDEEGDGFRQVFGPIFYDIGENGLIHAIKGFGVKNYYYATTINRAKCRVVDSAIFAMGINFVKGNDTPDESPPVENYGAVNIFPPGLTQLQIQPNLQAVTEVMQMLKENQDENNYQYNDSGARSQIAETDTARQAEILSSLQSEMTTAQSSTFLSQIGGNIYHECFRRLCLKDSDDPDAKEFQRRCRERMVPEEVIFKSKKRVTTSASPTMASPGMRSRIASDLMATVYNQPDANRRAILEFKVANSTGSRGVKDFLLPVGVASDPRARREQMMENVDLAQGIELPVAPSDAHVEHADECLKPLEAIIQQLNKAPIPGMTVVPQKPQITPDHLIALQMSIPHAQAHVGYLAQDETRRQQYKEMKARLAQVFSVYRGIVIRLSKAQASGADRNKIQGALMPPTS